MSAVLIGVVGVASLRADRGVAPSKVRFELLASNHVVVNARLNGKGPYRLIFDLGSPVTLLSSKAAEAVGATEKNAPKAFLFVRPVEGKLKTLEIGALKAEDLSVMVMDHPSLKLMGEMLGQPLDGILGYTFFARYKLTIDYKARELTFVPVDFAVRDLFKDMQTRMSGPKVAKTRVLAPLGYWGLEIGAATENGGVPITAVRADSPASRAGLRVGDVLTSIDGRWTASITDTFTAAAAAKAGTPVDVVILRDGEEKTLSLTPAEGL